MFDHVDNTGDPILIKRLAFLDQNEELVKRGPDHFTGGSIPKTFDHNLIAAGDDAHVGEGGINLL